MKIALLSANLGGVDKEHDHVSQSISYDYFGLNDENFPPRSKAMMPRLQAKIPKFFGWQLFPGYDYYMWLDGSIALAHEDAIKYFKDSMECCGGHDIVVLRHPRRPNIRQEARYLRKGLREQSKYLVARYDGEWTPEQIKQIDKDRHYVDDLMVNGGVFMYRNNRKVRAMFKEWWYQTSRYSVFDQIAFAYVLKKSGLNINIRPDVYNNCPWLKDIGHKYHEK